MSDLETEEIQNKDDVKLVDTFRHPVYHQEPGPFRKYSNTMQ